MSAARALETYAVALPAPDDFDAWRDAARGLLLAAVPPEQVVWSVGESDDLFAAPPPSAAGLVGNLTVPKPFLTLAETAILHADRERFALLYTLLWRLQTDRALMQDHADPLVDRLEDMAKAVRRDIHKMRAFLRFRELDSRFVAWFEPDHHIVRANAGFFIRRFATMRWSILTPEVSVHWDGETLTEGPPAQKADAPEGDPVEEVWKTYYANIFNPARVKVGAMLKEMPKKYWKDGRRAVPVHGRGDAGDGQDRPVLAVHVPPRELDRLRAHPADQPGAVHQAVAQIGDVDDAWFLLPVVLRRERDRRLCRWAVFVAADDDLLAAPRRQRGRGPGRVRAVQAVGGGPDGTARTACKLTDKRSFTFSPVPSTAPCILA